LPAAAQAERTRSAQPARRRAASVRCLVMMPAPALAAVAARGFLAGEAAVAVRVGFREAPPRRLLDLGSGDAAVAIDVGGMRTRDQRQRRRRLPNISSSSASIFSTSAGTGAGAT